MVEKNRGIWEKLYKEDVPTDAPEIPRSSLSAFIAQMQASAPQTEDDFWRYINGNPTPLTEWHKTEGLFHWWMTCDYPQLRQWAFDVLSIPAMSAELERVFSQAKRSITSDRNRQLAATFEAQHCLRDWLRKGLYNIGAG